MERPTDAAAAAPAVADHVARERRIITAILAKDRKAAAEFVAEHADAVYSYLRHRLVPRLELVDDLVQDVFVAAFASLDRFRGTSPVRAWLLGIARHKVEEHYRQRLRGDQPLDEDDAVPAPPDERSIEDRIDEARAAIRTRRILEQLPEAYSAALLWRYWESRSVREIASATGKTEKAVERLLARARTRFRELWKGGQT